MQVHLVSPRLSLHKGDFLGSGVPYWPVELAVFAGFLRQHFDEPRVTDLFGLSPSTFTEDGGLYWQGLDIRNCQNFSLEDELFIVYAISYMSLEETVAIVEYLKCNFPGRKVAVLENSQAVTAFDLNSEADQIFLAGADFLILGEPYFNWGEIVAFTKGEIAPPGNVRTPTGDKGIQRRYSRQESYPNPAWDLFPIENYWRLPYSHGPKRARKYFPMLTSRGCPWPCDFCVVPETNDRRWRGRPPENVVNEILHLKKTFGANHFQLEDLNPTVRWPRFAAVCEELIVKKADITFSIVSGTKAETVPLDAVPLLSRAGCRYLSISPESGSDSLMRVIGKRFNYDHAAKLISLCRQHGIRTQACFLVGHPAETAEDFRASCSYLKTLIRDGLDEVAVFVVSPFSGSALHQDNKIILSSDDVRPTFGPEGRAEAPLFTARRRIMLRLFFLEKLKCGLDLWAQGVRALFARPQTKMENLPKRIAFVLGHIYLKKYIRLPDFNK